MLPHDLSVTALSLTSKTTTLMLVSADVIWFGSEMSDRLRSSIAAMMGVEPRHVILAASHTHGSPQPDPMIPFGEKDLGWSERLESAVLAAATSAVAGRPTPVTLYLGRADLGGPVTVNRRRMAPYRDGARLRRRVQNMPNPRKPVDQTVTVIVARDATKQVRAVIWHGVCHPVSLPRDVRGPDFPGIVRHRLKARFGSDVPVLFLQGFCGDVRPRLILRPQTPKDWLLEWAVGPRFRPSAPGDTERLGAVFADAAARAIEAAVPIEPDLGADSGALNLLDVAGAPVGRNLDITGWRLAPCLAIMAASGEMLSGLASTRPGVLSVGYANGMVGYVAPQSEYAGGGYEIDGFLPAFGLRKRFSPQTQASFEAEQSRLLQRLQVGRAAAGTGSATTQLSSPA